MPSTQNDYFLCQTCEAMPGEPCVDEDGKVLPIPHDNRPHQPRPNDINP